MTRSILSLIALAAAAPILSAAPVPPGGNAGTVFPYPAKAQIVVSVNGYDKARERLNKMLAAAVPDEAPALAKQIDEGLQQLLMGRKLTGVRKDARIFLVVNDIAGFLEQKFTASLLIPVTSYKEFRDGFLTADEAKSLEKGREGIDSVKSAVFGEDSVYLVDMKDYVVLTPDKGVADSYAAKYTAGSTEPMGAAADTFLQADVALYVNMDAINDQFGDKIRQFKGVFDLLIQQGLQQGVIPGLNKKQIESMKTVFTGLFQGIEDSRAIVAAAEFRPEGLLFRLEARFAQNTPSSRLIQADASPAMKGIGKLPKGLDTYQESHLGALLSGLMQELNQAYAVAEDDEKGAEKLSELLKDPALASPHDEVSGSRGKDGAIVVSHYKEPAKSAEVLTRIYKTLGAGGRINSVVLKTAPKVSEQAEKHRGFTFTEVRLQFDFEATAASLPENLREGIVETFKRTMNEKTTLWVGTDGKVLVNLSGKDWAAAKALLDEYLDGGKEAVGEDASFAATRSRLPAEASGIVIADTSAAIAQMMAAIKPMLEMVPGAPHLGTIKPLKGHPTYVGVSVTLKGDRINITAFVPTGAMAAGWKTLSGLFKRVE